MQGCEAGPRVRHWLTLFSGMFECLGFAGVVFGYASLVFVLKEDGYFDELCTGHPGSNSTLQGTGEHLRRSVLKLTQIHPLCEPHCSFLT